MFWLCKPFLKEQDLVVHSANSSSFTITMSFSKAGMFLPPLHIVIKQTIAIVKVINCKIVVARLTMYVYTANLTINFSLSYRNKK